MLGIGDWCGDASLLGKGRCGKLRSTWRSEGVETWNKIVEIVLERGMEALVDNIQFCFVQERWTTNALFMVREVREQCREKDEESYLYLVNLKIAFGGVPRGVKQLKLGKKDLSEI